MFDFKLFIEQHVTIDNVSIIQSIFLFSDVKGAFDFIKKKNILLKENNLCKCIHTMTKFLCIEKKMF